MERRRGSPAIQVGREMRIEADPERVWEVLADLGEWSRWHPGISFARLLGALERGTMFHMRLDGMNVVSAVDEVEPGRALGWRGQCFGARLQQKWHLEPAGGGTLVRARESVDGLMVRILQRTVQRTVERSLDAWMRGLKARAEGGRTEGRA